MKYKFSISILCSIVTRLRLILRFIFKIYFNITNYGEILLFPSNFLCSSRISFTFPSKFISFKFPSFCKKFLSKGNFLQSGSAAREIDNINELQCMPGRASNLLSISFPEPAILGKETKALG
jgi:hypothetical protein